MLFSGRSRCSFRCSMSPTAAPTTAMFRCGVKRAAGLAFFWRSEETALAHAEAGGFDAVLEGSADAAGVALVNLARATAAAIRLPALEAVASALPLPSRRSIPARKELQLPGAARRSFGHGGVVGADRRRRRGARTFSRVTPP